MTSTDLVTQAADGDREAWDALVERYAPLVWSICWRYRLAGTDADNVGQSVWMQLAGRLTKDRDPPVLPDWLAAATERECAKARPVPTPRTAVAERDLLLAEQHAALRAALGRLLPGCEQLMAMLLQDPPVPYAQIGARLGIPVESIASRRALCLDHLRRDLVIAAPNTPEARSAGP
jgi:DNA-directed RNA polymerase specialized sigma24 family protein